MKMAVFWIDVLCTMVKVYQHFIGAHCLHNQDIDGGSNTEMSVIFNLTTQHNNPEVLSSYTGKVVLVSNKNVLKA